MPEIAGYSYECTLGGMAISGPVTITLVDEDTQQAEKCSADVNYPHACGC